MVKRRIFRIAKYLSVSLAAALLVLMALVGWLLGTSTGAKLLLGEVSRFAPVHIEAKDVEGRIWGNLRIRDLNVAWPDGTAVVHHITLSWSPGALISGRLEVGRLAVTGVRVQDNAPESDEPPSLAWPTLNGPLARRSVLIRSLLVKDVSYRKKEADPVIIKSLSADLSIKEGKLTVQEIGIAMPQFRAEGSLAMGLLGPDLLLNATYVPAEPLAEMERFVVDLRMRPGNAGAEAEGAVRVEGISGKVTVAEAEGDIKITKQSLGLGNLRIRRPGIKGSVTGEGEVVIAAEGASLRARLLFLDITVSRERQFPITLNGSVAIEGSMDDYQGNLSLSSRGEGWRAGKLEAAFTGASSGFVLKSLQGEWLAGTVKGRGRAAWKKGMSVQASLEARGLDPSGLAPEWKGAVNMDLGGVFRVAEGGKPVGSMSLRLLESRVRGQALSGDVQARVKGDNISIDRLAIQGKGFEATARGDLEKRLRIEARLSDLSLFGTGLGGEVGIDGWVRRSKGRIAGDVAARGSGLQAFGARAASAELTVRVADSDGSPGTVQAALRDVSYNVLRVETVTFDAKGKFDPQERFDLSGIVSAHGGRLERRMNDVALQVKLSKADLAWAWRGREMSGRLSVALAEYGQAEARFSLPLPARFPLSVERAGVLDVSVQGSVEEKGVLSLLLPSVVQESHGRIIPHITVGGTWAAPKVTGSLSIEDAGAYVPPAGIRVAGLQLRARIEQNRLVVDSLSARSGDGSIEAKAIVTLGEDRRTVRYSGSLSGERFQTVFLPEFQMLCDPDLEFEGTERGLSVRGEIIVPELLINGPPKETAVQPSKDVVIVSSEGPVEDAAHFNVDVRIRIVLGERVIVNVKGADAQLGGDVLMSMNPDGEIAGTGEIKVIKGRYSTYGVALDITRGRILFSGGPIDNPTLDILALRTVGDVRAGVFIGGVVQDPVIKLYSEPSMPDADILAYMVLGHPLGQDRAQGDYLMQAAAVILSAGQSVSLQEQLKRRFGIDTIEVQTGQGDVEKSVVAVGKYLSPKLYVSYGRSLFTGENLFLLRYKLSKRWEFETKTGNTSAADLFYSILFD